MTICFYYAKINREKTKKSFIFRTNSQQILKYTITRDIKKQTIAIRFIIAVIFANFFAKLLT